MVATRCCKNYFFILFFQLHLVCSFVSLISFRGFALDGSRKHLNQFKIFAKPDAPRKGPADNDFISRFFSKLLPAPEDIGLTRFDVSTRPENYPCVKDKFASLLDSDAESPDKTIVRQLLKNTNLETRDLKLIYDANEDGWKAIKFHEKLDKKGPALVLARTKSGGVFGGYNPCGWVNYGEYRGSIAAFLFVFPKGDVTQRPVKLAKICGAGLAQVSNSRSIKYETFFRINRINNCETLPFRSMMARVQDLGVKV
jgi:TLD